MLLRLMQAHASTRERLQYGRVHRVALAEIAPVILCWMSPAASIHWQSFMPLYRARFTMQPTSTAIRRRFQRGVSAARRDRSGGQGRDADDPPQRVELALVVRRSPACSRSTKAWATSARRASGRSPAGVVSGTQPGGSGEGDARQLRRAVPRADREQGLDGAPLRLCDRAGISNLENLTQN